MLGDPPSISRRRLLWAALGGALAALITPLASLALKLDACVSPTAGDALSVLAFCVGPAMLLGAALGVIGMRMGSRSHATSAEMQRAQGNIGACLGILTASALSLLFALALWFPDC